MNMLNRNCKTSYVKPEFIKKAQRVNPRLYDIGCYNDNLALMLALESDEIRVIPTTSVSRPQLKINRLEDRVIHNNSEGKKQEVEDRRRNFQFLIIKRLIKMPMVVPISSREPNRTVNQSVATPLKRTVAAESTNQKPQSIIKKQYEQISKTCKCWYCKITPPGYKWIPKSRTVNVEQNVSMPLGTKSRTTNISKLTTLRKSTVSNNSSSSNFFVARRDNFIHRRLWVLKAHDVQSQASKFSWNRSVCTPNPNSLMAKGRSSQAWLWHRPLSHLNFDTINLLLKYDIMTGLPKLKFIKDHLCSSCE
ncbi:retrovirus-related pol polyprotein from transposon TNT 1-94, partial [Tanacetum coccineum]